MSTRKDIIGQRFGKLVVVKFHHMTPPYRVYWLCKCDCSNEKVVRADGLASGDVKSCGCINIDRLRLMGHDLTGRKFGRLTVIRKTDERTSNRVIKWYCECDCNGSVFTASDCLVSGNTQSCGCLQREVASEMSKARGGSLSVNWKGGITPLKTKIRNSNPYQEWRLSIFERDDYICQKCITKGVKLNAHHITNFASIYEEDDEILYDIGNGITFCESCHREFHKKYDKKDNTQEQIMEFLIIKNIRKICYN